MPTSHRLFALGLFSLAIAGCGGGNSSSGSAGMTPSASSTTAAAATDGSAASTSSDHSRIRALGVASTGTSNLTYNFDANFTSFAPGWWLNWWGSSYPGYEVSRETRAGYAISGASQRFKLSSVAKDGDANLVYSYAFSKDTKYQIGINVRSDLPTKVRFQFRLDGFPYTEIASKIVDVTSTWQQVTLEGVYPFADPGSVRVIPATYGNDIYLDDMTINVAPPETVAVTPTVQTAANAVALLAQGTSSIALAPVMTTNMDDAFALFAPGWYFNEWGGADLSSFSVSRETRADHVYAGTASQKFQVIDKKGGEVHLIAPYSFSNGKTYHISAYLRSDVPTPVQFFLRSDAPPWQPVATTTVTVGTTWQKVDLEGAYTTDATGSVRVSIPGSSGTVWIDEMTISEVTQNDLAPVTSAPVPDTLFGMHVNRLGTHFNWPGLGTKMVRLWDIGTTWRDIKPTAGAWDFSSGGGQRLDMYVDYVRKNEPQASMIYTLGQTPTWASSAPTEMGGYGLGAANAPRDMNDWRDYVRTLAKRYAGRIRYWELWNEPDYAGNYVGSMSSLVEMARIAREELLAADPGNVLVGPGFSGDQGMNGLDVFLTAGGGQYIDKVGFHWYYSNNPESLVSRIDNVRNILKVHGIGDKPLWNTEAAFICNPAAVDCSTALPTPEESRSVNARALFLMADKGIENFNYYYWETDEHMAKLVESDLTTPTASALTFSEARSWIRGAQVVDAYRIDDKVYVMRFTRGTANFVVLWATKANTAVTVPAAWNVKTARTLTGSESAIVNSGLTVGLEPLMLKQ
jgi:hypothetical protein